MTATKLLSTGAILSVNDRRVRIDLPIHNSHHSCYRSLSSAILNGGDHAFTFSSSTDSSSSSSSTAALSTAASTKGCCRVINCLVSPTYDGFSPSPINLLRDLATKEELVEDSDDDSNDVVKEVDISNTIGLLTAACMTTCSTSSASAMGMYVDVIVTAGLSNARCAGADADYFVISSSDDEKNDSDNDGDANLDNDTTMNGKSTAHQNGTINTTIIINGKYPLTPSARIEAYAIAIEAKCRACHDNGIMCEKDPTRVACGTGTDCCVLICPSTMSTMSTTMTTEKMAEKEKNDNVVKHAGKHTILAELVGQAVYEATSQSIMINITNLYGSYIMYTLRRWTRLLTCTIGGARPMVPLHPMMPVSSPPISIVCVGILLILLIYISPIPNNKDSIKLLLAAVIWDRYLGEPPLHIHPVCLAGSAISLTLKYTPDLIFHRPVLGFVCGLLLLILMTVVFMAGAWMFIQVVDAMAGYDLSLSTTCVACDSSNNVCVQQLSYSILVMSKLIIDLLSWLLKVILLKSTFSLQLLLSVSLQMAHHLERNRIHEARAQLSWLCSRDPSLLCVSDLAGATLESLSENLSDGFVAPLFWYVIFGGSSIGALTYRVVNTLDSRIGYHGKYEWFGKASARLDDIINLIPARIAALLLASGAVITRVRGEGRGGGGINAAKVGLHMAWKDCRLCESPNAGWPMACFAGILGVRLKKEGVYCLGACGADPGPENVREGHRVAQIAGGLFILLAVLMNLIH